MIQLIAGSRDFHSAISKMNFGIQEAISPILWMISWFKHSLDATIDLEEEEIKRLKDLDV